MRTKLLICAGMIAVLCAMAAGPKQPTVRDFLPDQNVWQIDDFYAGAPDHTGNARFTVQIIKSSNLDGPGDRSKSRWHSDDRCLNERRTGDVDYANNPLSKDKKLHPEGVARGHSVEAQSHSRSQEAIDSTHNISANCYLQDQAFNRGSWQRCEQRGIDLRRLADKLKIKALIVDTTVPLYVLAKPPHDKFEDFAWVGTFNATGPHCVWYPSHLSKTYAVTWGKRHWVETYVFENAASVADDPIENHIAATDVVEFESNLNLNPGIENEDELEAFSGAPPTLKELEAEQ